MISSRFVKAAQTLEKYFFLVLFKTNCALLLSQQHIVQGCSDHGEARKSPARVSYPAVPDHLSSSDDLPLKANISCSLPHCMGKPSSYTSNLEGREHAFYKRTCAC